MTLPPWESFVSSATLVRDDNGQPITVLRYSDSLLVALLNAHRPPRREKLVRLSLPALAVAGRCARRNGLDRSRSRRGRDYTARSG